jgi:AcrR family transcriptional regulator
MNKQEQRSEETRTSILAAAESCFAHYGYDGTSVSQICQAAGVSKGALYHHFSSKQAIFLELLARWLAAMDIQLSDPRSDAASVPNKLLTMSAILGMLTRTPKDQLLIYLEFISKAARDPQVWEKTVEPYRHYQEQITSLIKAGIAEGTLHPVEPSVASRTVIALAMGFLLQGFMDPTGADWEKVTRDGFSILLHGLQVN